jgi:hypothetical protein
MSDKEAPKNYDLAFAIVFANLAYLARSRDAVVFVFCTVLCVLNLVLVALDWYRNRLLRKLGINRER